MAVTAVVQCLLDPQELNQRQAAMVALEAKAELELMVATAATEALLQSCRTCRGPVRTTVLVGPAVVEVTEGRELLGPTDRTAVPEATVAAAESSAELVDRAVLAEMAAVEATVTEAATAATAVLAAEH
jgi:hypothetical protein